MLFKKVSSAHTMHSSAYVPMHKYSHVHVLAHIFCGCLLSQPCGGLFPLSLLCVLGQRTFSPADA